MKFLPRSEILSLEELYTVARHFTALGVRKIRLTGGEPLVRHGILRLAQALGRLDGLRELALSTNGARLPGLAAPLRDAGVRRVNISLDSLDPAKFKRITRTGELARVLAGIDAAIAAGFEGIKLNAVILKGRNEDEVTALAAFALDKGLDISFIEEMPLGLIDEHNRQLSFCSSFDVRRILARRYRLAPEPAAEADDANAAVSLVDADAAADAKGAAGIANIANAANGGGRGASAAPGPSRYYRVEGYASRIGFISPHSQNFCHLCNRVRVTVAGRLLLCLGNEHSVDLRAILRRGRGRIARGRADGIADDAAAGPARGVAGSAAQSFESDAEDPALRQALIDAMAIKPEKHHFDLDAEPDILRFMNATGG